MSNHKKGRIHIYLLLALAIMLKHSSALAVFETIKAKSLDSTTSNTSTQSEYLREDFDEDLPNFNRNNNLSTFLFDKFKEFTKKDKVKPEEKKEEEIQEETISNTAEISQKYIQEKPQQIEEKNKFQINADKVTYDDESGNVIAKGHVEIIAKAQKITLKADTAILEKDSQTLKLQDNVRVLKNGTEMRGEYLLVNLNKENILMDNPTYEAYSFQIQAQEGYLIANDIQMLNGTIKSTKEKDFPLISRGFMRLDNINREFAVLEKNQGRNTHALASDERQNYKIDTKEIIITSFKDHNSLQMKKADIFYNNHKIIRNSDIEIITDKTHQTIETSTPEAGNLRNFGTYVGYGFVQKLPKGQTLKFMPVLAYSQSDIGVGAILRHRSPNSMVEGGWNTASENLVVRGKYRFNAPVMLSYGRNAYMPEGFLGARRSGYAAQLQFEKSYMVEDLNIRFNHGVYAGIFSDYQKHDQEDAYSTTRFRYIAEVIKKLAQYHNPEQDFTVTLNALAQGAGTVYGSGETAAIARAGSYVTTKFKRWESSIGYIFAGVHGDSPFIFDKYRYGKSSIIINEKFNFTDNFSLGFRTYVSPLKDNYEEDLLTECRFYAIVGPKDLKLAFSYDFYRDLARMDFMFLIGSKSSHINFEKLTTKNMDGSEEKYDFYRASKPIKITEPYKKQTEDI